MRTIVFSGRNLKELLRDPLSYIFCLGFPIVMLLIMTVVNSSIPPEAGMTVFRIDNLSGGIAVFGLSFVMLFAALLLSPDRTGAFLTRLYASPMKAWEFIGGYYLPIILLSVIQSVIAFAASFVIAAAEDVQMNVGRVLFALLSLVPTAVMFIGFGLFFGSVMGSNAAPGLCSIIISAAGMLGGIWMDVESIGGGLRSVCLALLSLGESGAQHYGRQYGKSWNGYAYHCGIHHRGSFDLYYCLQEKYGKGQQIKGVSL